MFIYLSENWDTGIIVTQAISRGEERERDQICERNKQTPETEGQQRNVRMRDRDRERMRRKEREKVCRQEKGHKRTKRSVCRMVKGREERRGKDGIKGEERKSKVR